MKPEIYFLHDGSRIKIGKTRKGAEKRAQQIKVSLGLPLNLLGTVEGGGDLEKHIHEKLAAHRIGGEWFSDCAEVRAVMDDLMNFGAAAIGFVPKAKAERQPYVPAKRTPEEYSMMMAKLVAMVWPHDGIQQLVAFTDYPESEVRAWLNGQKEWPRLVTYAFSAVVAQFTFGGTTENFVEQNEATQEQQRAATA